MSGVKGRSGRKGSYAKQLSKALGLIDRDLPLLIEKLLERGLNGDREALIYLIDRRLGKPKAPLDIEGGEKLGFDAVALFSLLVQQQKQLIEPVIEIEEVNNAERRSQKRLPEVIHEAEEGSNT